MTSCSRCAPCFVAKRGKTIARLTDELFFFLVVRKKMDEDDEDRGFSRDIVTNYFEQAETTFESMDTSLCVGGPTNANSEEKKKQSLTHPLAGPQKTSKRFHDWATF